MGMELIERKRIIKGIVLSILIWSMMFGCVFTVDKFFLKPETITGYNIILSKNKLGGVEKHFLTEGKLVILNTVFGKKIFPNVFTNCDFFNENPNEFSDFEVIHFEDIKEVNNYISENNLNKEIGSILYEIAK